MQEARNNMANFPQEGGSTDWKLLSFFVKTRHRYALGLICILIRYFFGILRYQRCVKFVYRHSLIYAVNVGTHKKGSHPVWPRDSFGPTLTLARKYFGPEYFVPKILWPETTLARKIVRPAYILWPGNNFGPENTSARLYTSARKYFGPIDFGPLHFGPGNKLSKVSFFIIFDLP